MDFLKRVYPHTITLTRHDQLRMPITAYKYSKKNMFLSKHPNISCTIYFKKSPKFSTIKELKLQHIFTYPAP